MVYIINLFSYILLHIPEIRLGWSGFPFENIKISCKFTLSLLYIFFIHVHMPVCVLSADAYIMYVMKNLHMYAGIGQYNIVLNIIIIYRCTSSISSPVTIIYNIILNDSGGHGSDEKKKKKICSVAGVL